jgi:hypothetical protein
MSIAVKAFRLMISYIINSECFMTSPFLVHTRIFGSSCNFLQDDVRDIHKRLSTGWALLVQLPYTLATDTMPTPASHNYRWHHVVEAYWAFEFTDDIPFFWLHTAEFLKSE